MDINHPHYSLLIGQAGVWRVASELAVRGVLPMMPGVDIGADLYAVNGCRIQVKTAKLRKNSAYPEGAYWFKFWQANVLAGNNTIRKRGARDYSLCTDVMVLWGRDEDRFWVFPSALVASTQCLTLGPKGFYQRSDFAEAKRLREEGLSQREIADILGITQEAVSYQLRGGRTAQPKETMSAKARKHEGRWDLIVDFGKTGAAEPAN
jgi:hypothetical protein